MKEAFKTTENEVQSYTDKELQLWNKGYLAAIEGLLEQLQEDKIRILNQLLIVSGHKKRRTELVLQSKLIILDAYDEHFTKRLLPLQRDAE